jgi:hypothetical protein
MKETGNTCQVFGPEIEAFLKSIHLQASAGIQL